MFQAPDAKLGGLSLCTGSPVIAADLRRMREACGYDVYGFIGMDFLAKHVIRIDPDRGEVVFLRSAGPEPGRRLPLTFESGVPHVLVQIAGMDESQLFLVDTGCSPGGGTGLLQVKTFEALAKQGKIKPTDHALGQSLCGTTLGRRGKVEAITVVGHRHADLIFSASQRNILGLNFWSRYVATFDFSGRAIYLKSGSGFDQPDTQDSSSLTVIRAAGRTVVVAVEEESPAALAGMRPQDVVLKANGDPAEDLTLVALRRLLAVKGATVSLVFRRGGEEREVELVLRGRQQP